MAQPNLGLEDIVAGYLRSDPLVNLGECQIIPQDLAVEDHSIVVEGHVMDHSLSIHLPKTAHHQ